MGTFFKSGKDKAVKGEGWARPFLSCAQDTTPTDPIAIRLCFEKNNYIKFVMLLLSVSNNQIFFAILAV